MTASEETASHFRSERSTTPATVRREELLEKAITIDGRRQWPCNSRGKTHVWTRGVASVLGVERYRSTSGNTNWVKLNVRRRSTYWSMISSSRFRKHDSTSTKSGRQVSSGQRETTAAKLHTCYGEWRKNEKKRQLKKQKRRKPRQMKNWLGFSKSLVPRSSQSLPAVGCSQCNL